MTAKITFGRADIYEIVRDVVLKKFPTASITSEITGCVDGDTGLVLEIDVIVNFPQPPDASDKSFSGIP